MINMERIDSQHFTVHMNYQLPIIDPGEILRTMQSHYIRAKHGAATSVSQIYSKSNLKSIQNLFKTFFLFPIS